MDSDYGSAPAETGAAYLAMLAIDCLLNVVAALEKLTDVAVEGTVVTPDASAGQLKGTVVTLHVLAGKLKALVSCCMQKQLS